LLKIERILKGNLIIIVGPTAVGKTDFCVQLAKKLNAEVISCDSRQLYKEMQIGTAKPTSEEMAGVVHHFIDSHSIQQLYSAGDYEREVEALLQNYFKTKAVAIMSGGTGLFVRAVTDGLDEMPAAPVALREQLMSRLDNEGLAVLQQELKSLDPLGFEKMDIQNPQRVVRALEVCISTGKPFSFFKQGDKKEHPYRIIKIGLERPREELYARINRRVDLMLEAGLVEEVKSLAAFEEHNALQTVGYKEVFGFLKNEYSYDQMVELLKRNTRRYAKRQMTWFKNQDRFEWFNAEDLEGVENYIKKSLSQTS
jgi:tRNA dimethylallyltransferase